MSESVRRTLRGSVPHIHNATEVRPLSPIAGPVPDHASHPLTPWTGVMDFEPHRLGSLDAERQVVYRNWRRKATPNFRKHVLVLDKDPQILEIIGQLLDDEGSNVTLASGSLSHELLGRLRPDVIVADTSLDSEPDHQLGDPPLRKADGKMVPIIYTTIFPTFVAGSAPGGERMLIKPFDLDDLLGTLRNALS